MMLDLVFLAQLVNMGSSTLHIAGMSGRPPPASEADGPTA